MTEFDYARHGGNVFPVQPGEVWTVDRHMLACGDLELGDGQRLLALAGSAPDIVYSDPPWGGGNAAAFRTKAGVPRKVDFDLFLRRLLPLVASAKRDVFLEMGDEHTRDLVALIGELGGRALQAWKITYYRKNPCWLIQASWHGQHGQAPDMTGMDDTATPTAAFEAVARPGDVIFDPCTGLGCTADAVARLPGDCRFVGLELHPKRMSATLTRLRGIRGEVKLLGRLADPHPTLDLPAAQRRQRRPEQTEQTSTGSP
jgi:hypothetical protein